MKPRRRAIALLVAVAGVACFEARSLAALPVYGGATYGVIPGTGYVEASIFPSPDRVINKHGTAIGVGVFRTPAVANGGMRPVIWTPTTWNSLSSSPAPASGIKNSRVYAINEAGASVGEGEMFNGGGTNLGYRAMRWDVDGAHQLSNLGASAAGVAESHAYAIRTDGSAVGTSSKYTGGVFRGKRATLWPAGTIAATELDTLQSQVGTNFVEASARDFYGTGIVGESGIFAGSVDLGTRPVRWNATNGWIIQLGVLGVDANGYTDGSAIGIMQGGVIAGVVSKYDIDHTYLGKRAVRYAPDSTTPVELGGLGGTDVNGFTSVRVLSVSDSGYILGASDRYLLGTDVGRRPVYWLASGSTAAVELPNLGTGGGVTSGGANAANADKVIVGSVEKFTNGLSLGQHAVMWTTVGADAVIDLNTLIGAGTGWTLRDAIGISDTGFVSGVGDFDPDGAGGASAYQRHFTMLVPQAGTYGRGDANFDTSVGFEDLVILAQKYGKTNNSKAVDVADLNLDGITDFADLVLLAQHYGAGPTLVDGIGGADFQADWALAQSLAPEPASLGLLGCVLGSCVRCRRISVRSMSVPLMP